MLIFLNFSEELWGVEDPRVVYIPELDKYAITYTAYSHAGPAVSLALTKDFEIFERCGVIMPPEDKNSALLPRKIGGQWVLIHRPLVLRVRISGSRIHTICFIGHIIRYLLRQEEEHGGMLIK